MKGKRRRKRRIKSIYNTYWWRKNQNQIQNLQYVAPHKTVSLAILHHFPPLLVCHLFTHPLRQFIHQRCEILASQQIIASPAVPFLLLTGNHLNVPNVPVILPSVLDDRQQTETKLCRCIMLDSLLQDIGNQGRKILWGRAITVVNRGRMKPIQFVDLAIYWSICNKVVKSIVI